MEKVRPWCGQPSDQGRLKNRTVQICELHECLLVVCLEKSQPDGGQDWAVYIVIGS